MVTLGLSIGWEVTWSLDQWLQVVLSARVCQNNFVSSFGLLIFPLFGFVSVLHE